LAGVMRGACAAGFSPEHETRAELYEHESYDRDEGNDNEQLAHFSLS
jgi:hypothetical protein